MRYARSTKALREIVDQQKHATGIASEAIVDRSRFRDAHPSRQQPLAVLNGLAFEHVDELRSRMQVHRKHRARFEANELHRASVGLAEILDLNAAGTRRRCPRQRLRIDG